MVFLDKAELQVWCSSEILGIWIPFFIQCLFSVLYTGHVWVHVCTHISFSLEGTVFTVMGEKICVPKIILIFRSSFHYEKKLLLLSPETDGRPSHENQVHYSYEPSSFLLSHSSLRKSKQKEKKKHKPNKKPPTLPEKYLTRCEWRSTYSQQL